MALYPNIYTFLSYNFAVIQWIMSCHKNRMTTHVTTLWRKDVTSLTMSMSKLCQQYSF